MTFDLGSSGKSLLKQVAQYQSYLPLPLLLSIQSMQFGHRLPPPCAIQKSDLPWAEALQLGSWHRLPPPCATQKSDLSLAEALQLGS